MKHEINNIKQWYLKHRKRHQLCHYDDMYGQAILGIAVMIVVISMGMIWNGS